MTFDALLKGVKKGAPDLVYYLHGDEDVLKDEAIRALLDVALEPGARDFNLDQRSAPDMDAEGMHVLLNTPPLLAARRVVVLRNAGGLRKKSKARDELLRYLSRPSASTVLIVVQAAGEDAEPDLAARGTAVRIDRLPPERVTRWIGHHARSLGLTLEPAAAELLVAVGGDDLSFLSRELEKLAGLADQGPVGAAQVAGLVGVRHGETVHDLVDATLDRDVSRAARLVEPVLEQASMTGVRVIMTLGTALVGTALARAELDVGTPRARVNDILFRHLMATRPFGLRSWKEEAARWSSWAERWTAAELSRALRLALDADRALKSSTITDDSGILTTLVLSLGVPEREAA
ncbi:MAG TPA: DNA polymerase III subunit delta [Gemmatimonadales bacterium]